MDESRTETTTCVEIDGRRFVLDADRHLAGVMADIEAAAARPNPTFVQLTDGDERVSVLVSSRTRVVVTVYRSSAAQEALNEPVVFPDADWDL